eukprot:5418814-Lingulodinium_polyedra.AAC.1
MPAQCSASVGTHHIDTMRIANWQPHAPRLCPSPASARSIGHAPCEAEPCTPGRELSRRSPRPFSTYQRKRNTTAIKKRQPR